MTTLGGAGTARKRRDLSALYGEAPATVEAALDGFNKQLAFAERRLQGHAHLVGKRFTSADIMLASCLAWATAYKIALPPTLGTYRDRQSARPAQFIRQAALGMDICSLPHLDGPSPLLSNVIRPQLTAVRPYGNNIE